MPLLMSACSSPGPLPAGPAGPAGPQYEVLVTVQQDGTPLAGCSVGFTGSPADGSGLTEPGFITGGDGRVGRALRAGSYTVSALCDSVPGGAGEQAFEVVDEDVEVVVDLVIPSA
ncbi:Ig-like domain-containing protein [Frigoribacterium salinisoli]